jgi:AcrR family transcriptional regulator
VDESLSPQKPRARRQPAERLRREILDAARELFVAEGYQSVSLRKIACRIGYTPMSIYLHFRDKAEILDCICEETFTGFREAGERLDLSSLPPRERLEAGLRNYIEFGLAHPHHYQLTFMTPLDDPERLARRRQIGRDAFERLRRLVEACVGEARRPGFDVDAASQAIWAAAHGVTSLLIARPDFPWVERERLIGTVLAYAVQSLGGCRGAAAATQPDAPAEPERTAS